jgi:toxin ParE1/3/4
MTARAVVPRERARRDVEEAIEYYAVEAGADVALGFVDALQKAFRAIGDHPGIGSPRYAHELDLPGLRSHRLDRFPFLLFYVEGEDRIDVWRVLHAQRDIPAWLREGED